ncbi:Elongation factor 2 kinase [Entamoeba marina]
MFTLLFVALTSAASCSHADFKTCSSYSSQNDFSYIMHVQTWPGHFCSDGCCILPTENVAFSGFSMHGYWPQYTGNTYPSCCSNPYNDSYVEQLVMNDADLLADVAEYWPSLKKCKFLLYEYSKHGTCAYNVYNGASGPADYVRAAIDIRKKVDLWTILSNNGVVADGQTRYDREWLRDIAEKEYGARGFFACSSSSVSEFRMCTKVDSSNKANPEFFDCPDDLVSKGHCGSSIYFKPFPTIDTYGPSDGCHVEVCYATGEVREIIENGGYINRFRLVRAKVDARSASFGKGGERMAFEGIFGGARKEIVLKHFNKEMSFDVYLETIERPMTCISLAELFNQTLVSEKHIHFIPTTLFLPNRFEGKYHIQCVDSSKLAQLTSKCGVFIVEPYLYGNFDEFKCNNGNIWYNSYHATLHAFSHLTWVYSNQKYLIANLQGVIIGNFCIALKIENVLHPPQNLNEEFITKSQVNEQLPSIPREPRTYFRKCVVLHTFKADMPGGLDLKVDVVIDITAKEGEWWKGNCNGKTVIFPKNHLKKHKKLTVKKGNVIYLVGKKQGYVRVGFNGKFGYIPIEVVIPN